MTEKFWRLKRLIVPVVLSKEPLRNLTAPVTDDIFIAAEDFASPELLADHLVLLSRDKMRYKRLIFIGYF